MFVISTPTMQVVSTTAVYRTIISSREQKSKKLTEEEAVADLLAGGKARAVTRESVLSSVRGKAKQSFAHGPGQDREKL